MEYIKRAIMPIQKAVPMASIFGRPSNWSTPWGTVSAAGTLELSLRFLLVVLERYVLAVL